MERQTRMLQAHVPIGCEGSNPFLRMIKRPQVKVDDLGAFYIFSLILNENQNRLAPKVLGTFGGWK